MKRKARPWISLGRDALGLVFDWLTVEECRALARCCRAFKTLSVTRPCACPLTSFGLDSVVSAWQKTPGFRFVLRKINERLSGVQVRLRSSFLWHATHIEVQTVPNYCTWHEFRCSVLDAEIYIEMCQCLNDCRHGSMHMLCRQGAWHRFGVGDPLWVIGRFLIDTVPVIVQEFLSAHPPE